MAFDGLFTRKTVEELKQAEDSHIDKIYQPSSNEICLVFRKKGFVKRTLLSVASGVSRVQFTEIKLENPEKPPMFCMLFRKYFSSAKLVNVSQKGFERIIEFTFETANEMGDRINPKVICELIGNSSNIILLNENGKIIDSLKRSDISANSRIIQPGATYIYPDPQDKFDLLTQSADEIIEKIKAKREMPLWRAILDTVGGFSPLISREIAYLSGNEDNLVLEVSDFSVVKEQLIKMKNTVLSENLPFLLIRDGNPFDFSFIPITQYGDLYEIMKFESFSELLDAFYLERERNAVRNRITGEVSKLVSNLISRANKRLLLRKEELKSCDEREILRIKGEILKANISFIEPGQSSVTLQNFYDENLAEIEIKLDPALNASANASRYFKEYKKKNVAAATLKELIADDEVEIDYLETVKDSLSRCETVADLKEIKNELKMSGYIKQAKDEKKQKSASATYKEYTSKEGYRIIVGKNNIQNDYITTKLASKNDVWFHTKNIHGSHVVVFSEGKEISKETVAFAASLAAKNSKASDSSNVPVDYTEIRNVKKPNGAKPGMVIYSKNKTIFVTP